LYSNALEFFALEFKSANNVIQMKDAETGKVIGKGIVDDREITISITCKDGKYKYDIDFAPPRHGIVINLDVYSFGYWHNITSYGTIKWNENTIKIEDVKMISQQHLTVLYDGTGTPMGMKRGYLKWKHEVDIAITQKLKEYQNMTDPNDIRNKVILENFITLLKKDMNAKSDF
jgi:hypothetical protein